MGIRTLLCTIALTLMTADLVSAQGDRKKQDGTPKPATRNNQGRPNQGGANRNSPDAMLRFLDKNKDGKISLDEAPERLKTRFDRIDSNTDGFIDRAEIEKMTSAMRNRNGDNPNPPKQNQKGAAGQTGFDLEQIMKDADRNNDGSLDKAEQQTVLAHFKEFQNRMRQQFMRDGAPKRNGQKGPSADNAKSRYARPDTTPIKPKRPGME